MPTEKRKEIFEDSAQEVIEVNGVKYRRLGLSHEDTIRTDSFRSSLKETNDAAVAKPFAFLPSKAKKRANVLSWDDYFMSVAFLSAQRSKDPNTQVGACIVNSEKRIVGIGYNGFPKNCDDDELPWDRESESHNELDTKYPYVCHAEMNAILNKNSADLQNCIIYVGLFPCNECAKMIIQSGIREVVYLSDKYKHTNSMIASRRLLTMSKISTRQHIPSLQTVQIHFPSVETVDKSM